ncbi:DUF1835 domain-containing protein [Psychroserpens sp. SPM9]|uniref:DUF1835 domain-containing protein n=1 Tax=Psychroserpens sp. SPM9 TaxID=2975598 RepID=UPI0021A7EC54|nr:DUF1835 domain-containing protein [Psychroserpens sp. SPM9]MDG5491969.1 DUF1835 domain-containing protein [Psychroserpens sp. SPM9]
MNARTLHITNGDSLSNYLFELKTTTPENTITWQETLCVGPTLEYIASEEFITARKSFFKSFYNITLSRKEIMSTFNKLNDISGFTEVVLWFEYDLFCHINMVAVISLLEQKGIKLPIYLVCSGRVPGEKGLKGLSELKPKQLESHYKNKVKLTDADISLAKNIWQIYCGKDHNLLLPLIVTTSSFKYMSNCLKAHIKRFPDIRSGISTLEYNILKLVKENTIKSKHHLVGYALHYQGYYGYGDLQLERVIDLLSIFFTEDNGSLKLNRKGHLALEHQHNYQKEMNNTIYFGGVSCLDYKFDKQQNKLIKTAIHAN